MPFLRAALHVAAYAAIYRALYWLLDAQPSYASFAFGVAFIALWRTYDPTNTAMSSPLSGSVKASDQHGVGGQKGDRT